MAFSKHALIIGIVVLVISSVFGFRIIGKAISESGKYDGFAKCLTENGVKMYGAFWCPHCNNQKQMFRDSWEYVTYIECSLPNGAGQTQFCNLADIKAYPTWEFKDGSRVEGELTFEQLSGYSGCQLY